MLHIFSHEEDYGQLATEGDAMREYAMNVGWYDRFKDCEWILTDYDVWVRNPHYSGPPQRHPEDDHYDDEQPTVFELNGERVEFLDVQTINLDDDIPF